MSTAQIRASGTGFVAELSDGQRIERGTLDELAAALHAAGVTAETAQCGDWREGAQILGAGQQIALKAALRRLAGLDHVTWTTEGDDPQTLDLRQVDTLTYRGLTVPVWEATSGRSTPFIRYCDLPSDLAEAFGRWQYGATMPFHRAAYHYDFDIFMLRGGKPEDAEIVAKYL